MGILAFFENLSGALAVFFDESNEVLHVWHGSRLVNIYNANMQCVDCYGLDNLFPRNKTGSEAFRDGDFTVDDVMHEMKRASLAGDDSEEDAICTECGERFFSGEGHPSRAICARCR